MHSTARLFAESFVPRVREHWRGQEGTGDEQEAERHRGVELAQIIKEDLRAVEVEG